MVSGSISKQFFNNRFRLSGVGPGGWNCTCCGPAPSYRKQFVRNRKRGVFKSFVTSLIKEGVQEYLDKVND